MTVGKHWEANFWNLKIRAGFPNTTTLYLSSITPNISFAGKNAGIEGNSSYLSLKRGQIIEEIAKYSWKVRFH